MSICNNTLNVVKLVCPECKTEFPADEELTMFDYLNESELNFLKVFLTCRGNLKELQSELSISYPTASKRLDELLIKLGLQTIESNKEKIIEKTDYSNFEFNEKLASDIIRKKMMEMGGR